MASEKAEVLTDADKDNKNRPQKKRTTKGKQEKTTEEIFNEFQSLRRQQAALVQKLSEIEVDLNEHEMIVQTLQDLAGSRKCFRMVGGILCERTVKDVIPEVKGNRDQLSNLIKTLNEDVAKKGSEINAFVEKYNIKIRGPTSLAGGTIETSDQKAVAT